MFKYIYLSWICDCKDFTCVILTRLLHNSNEGQFRGCKINWFKHPFCVISFCFCFAFVQFRLRLTLFVPEGNLFPLTVHLQRSITNITGTDISQTSQNITCSFTEVDTLSQRDLLFSAAMAAGIRLFPSRAFLSLSVRYLHPEGNGMRYWLSGCVVSRSIDFAKRVMALLFNSVRLGVGRPTIL